MRWGAPDVFAEVRPSQCVMNLEEGVSLSGDEQG